jgi:hypothetical protein
MASEDCTILTSIVFALVVSHGHKVDQQQQNSRTFFSFLPSKETNNF